MTTTMTALLPFLMLIQEHGAPIAAAAVPSEIAVLARALEARGRTNDFALVDDSALGSSSALGASSARLLGSFFCCSAKVFCRLEEAPSRAQVFGTQRIAGSMPALSRAHGARLFVQPIRPVLFRFVQLLSGYIIRQCLDIPHCFR